mmetsp:Transcript_18591/g.28550  ORF Transcript_18591/g.28550 Transcript_18591/m.28550 type:complete len:104 (+) Transcript_18591:201-512(+)
MEDVSASIKDAEEQLQKEREQFELRRQKQNALAEEYEQKKKTANALALQKHLSLPSEEQRNSFKSPALPRKNSSYLPPGSNHAPSSFPMVPPLSSENNRTSQF